MIKIVTTSNLCLWALAVLCLAHSSSADNRFVCLEQTISDGSFIEQEELISVTSSTYKVSCQVSCTTLDNLFAGVEAGNRAEVVEDPPVCSTIPALSMSVFPLAETGDLAPTFYLYADSATGLSYTCTCTESDSTGCFAPSTTVQVRDAGEVALSDLKVGSEVLTNVATQKYETVYAMAHLNSEEPTDYVQLFFDSFNDKPLEVTANHFMYVDGQLSPVRADSLTVGDIMKGGQKITAIDEITRNGRMNPLTASGKVVVNGNILASTYIDYEPASAFGKHVSWLSHLGVSPFRLACSHLMPTSDYCVKYTEDGIPVGLELWKGVCDSAMKQQSVVLNVLQMFGVFLVSLSAWIVEKLLAIPTIAMLAALVFAANRAAGVHFKLGGTKVKTA